jgi:hypothetical protein
LKISIYDVVIFSLLLIVDAWIYFCLKIDLRDMVSLLALELTLVTFWWINLRKGRIVAPKPRSFSICGGGTTGKIVMRVPLVFYNTGAIPIIVHNLRVNILETNGEPLIFGSTVFSIEKDGKPEDCKFATQFPIGGRNTFDIVCQFTRRQGIEFKNGIYNFAIEAQIADREKWIELCRFSFDVKGRYLSNINTRLLAYDLCDEND